MTYIGLITLTLLKMEVRPGLNDFEHVLWLEIFNYYELSVPRLQPSTDRYKIFAISFLHLYPAVEGCSLAAERSHK